MSACRHCGEALEIEVFYAGDKPLCKNCMMAIIYSPPKIREQLIKAIS